MGCPNLREQPQVVSLAKQTHTTQGNVISGSYQNIDTRLGNHRHLLINQFAIQPVHCPVGNNFHPGTLTIIGCLIPIKDAELVTQHLFRYHEGLNYQTGQVGQLAELSQKTYSFVPNKKDTGLVTCVSRGARI